jgi:ParB/RepB/Spo0J family partition protein
LVAEVLIDRELILPDSSQPRKTFDENAIASLREDIKENGLKEPIDINPLLDGRTTKYLNMDGECRMRATEGLEGYEQMPCRLYSFKTQKEIDDHRASKHFHRKDWNPADRAVWLKYYMETHKFRQQDLAREFNVKQATISHWVSPAKHEEVLKALRNADITFTQAILLSRIDSAEQRKNALSDAMGKTREETEGIINRLYSADDELTVTESEVKERLAETEGASHPFAEEGHSPSDSETPEPSEDGTKVDDGEGDSSLTSDEKEHPPSPETTGNIIEDAFAKPEREAQPSSESPLEVGTEPSLDTEPEEDPEPPEEAEKPKDDFPMVSKVLKRYELTKKATEPDPMTFMPKLPNEKQQTMIRETRRTGEHLICYSARLRASTNGETFESAKLVACKPMVKGLTIEDIKESKEVENAISSITEMRTKLDDHLNVLIKRR